MAKLLAILGSPRTGGNTDLMLGLAMRSAAGMGFETKKIELGKLDIRPCRACIRCSKGKECSIHDDMAFVLREIEKADMVAVGSPVYFGGISAQLKTLVDRSQIAWARKYLLKQERTAKRKEGIFLLTGKRPDRRYMACAGHIMDIFFRVMDIRPAGRVFAPGTEEKRDVLSDMSSLEKIKVLTEKCVRSLRRTV